MKRSLLIPLIILVALLVLYVIINSARDVTSKPEQFVAVDTTHIDGFTITNSKAVIDLRRSGAGWRIAEPIDYPAESRYVSDLLKKIGEMQVENLVTRDADKDSTYGLDTAGVDVAVYSKGEEIAHFTVGKAAENFRHTYCRKVGDDRIYRVKGTFTSQLGRQQKDWRDKKILELDRDMINRIDFEYPRETFSLVKADTVWTLEIGSESRPVEERVISQTVSIVSRFRTFDFVDGDSARALDFSNPDLTFTVGTDVEDTYKFSLIPEDEEENRYLVKKEGLENTLFVIYKGTANSIMKHPDDYKPVEKDSDK